MTPIVRVSHACLLVAVVAASARAATVRGTVTVAAGALSHAVVASYDAMDGLRATATTDASGQYTLTLPSGGYRLLAYDPSGAYATVFYGNAESFETTAFLQLVNGSLTEVSFTLPRGGLVSGLVTAANAPLASGVVEAYNLSGTRRGSTTADASGRYSLVLPAGYYKVFAYDANDSFAGEFATNASAFADAAIVRVDPPATTTVSFVLERAARASGAVVDAQTRAPLAGKLVYAYTAAGSPVATNTTDASGAFRLSLGPGPYRFVAADPSRVYAPVFYVDSRSFERSDVVTLAAGEVRSGVTLAAERGGIVSGRVSATGKTFVVAYNLDGTQHTSVSTNDAGEYALVVAPGTYKPAVIDPNGVYATQFYPGTPAFASATELTVLVAQTLTAIDFNPPRAGRFTGTVRDGATQQPLAGITTAAYDAAGVRIAQTMTATDGTYRLAVTPGQYRLVAFDTWLKYATAYAAGATSYETTIPLNVDADHEQSAVFVMWRGVRVTGTVADENGAGIDGAEVFALDAAGNRVAAATTSSGAFTLVVQSGMYTLIALDPRHRYAMRSPAAPVAIGSTPPPPVTITMNAITRRRSVRS